MEVEEQDLPERDGWMDAEDDLILAEKGGRVIEKGERHILWHLSVTVDIEFVERNVN